MHAEHPPCTACPQSADGAHRQIALHPFGSAGDRGTTPDPSLPSPGFSARADVTPEFLAALPVDPVVFWQAQAHRLPWATPWSEVPTWTPPDPADADLQGRVGRPANALTALGVGPGDRVVVHLPVLAATVVVASACAGIGAVHSLVFGVPVTRPTVGPPHAWRAVTDEGRPLGDMTALQDETVVTAIARVVRG